MVRPSVGAAGRRLAARGLKFDIAYTSVLTRAQTTRRIVVPQAVRNVVPALLNIVVALQKDSGLISILGAVDAIRVAQISVTGDYNFTPYVAAGFLFLVVSIPLTRAVDAYNARRGWRGARGVGGAIR